MWSSSHLSFSLLLKATKDSDAASKMGTVNQMENSGAEVVGFGVALTDGSGGVSGFAEGDA